MAIDSSFKEKHKGLYHVEVHSSEIDRIRDALIPESKLNPVRLKELEPGVYTTLD